MTDPTLAQRIIEDLISIVQRGGQLDKGLGVALASLVMGLGADRGLIWQVVGDQLAVTHEDSPPDEAKLLGKHVETEASTRLVLNFLSRFADSYDDGVITVQVDSDDAREWKPILEESEGFSSHLFVQLRAQFFYGFLALQSKGPRQWSPDEIATVRKVSALMSVLINDQRFVERVQTDALELKAILKISHMFLEHRAGPAVDILLKSVAEIARLMGFAQSRLYLYNEGAGTLIRQGSAESSLNLSSTEDPFVAVFQSGRGKLFDSRFTKITSYELFANHNAIILPLINQEEGKRLGVFALWERGSDRPFTAQDRELGLTMAGELSNAMVMSGCTFESQ